MTIISESALVNAPAATIFDFLSDAKNINKLLPQDSISDFQSDEHGCSFRVQADVLIPLVYQHKELNKRIDLRSGPKAPFHFTLAIHLEDKGSQTEGHLEFKGDVNMVFKMLIKKPLTDLFNSMVKKMKEEFQ